MQSGINGRQTDVAPQPVLCRDVRFQFFHGGSADGFAFGTRVKVKRGVYLVFNDGGRLHGHAVGCTLFDIEQLKRENSADDFKNLFMCEFVDDKASVFPFEELQRCMVDTLEEWEDYAPFAANPFGSRPVWIGYDPSHRGDSAGCVVLAPPVVAGGKFRILERHQWKGMDFATQAESIRKLTEKYNVEYIGIDATGLGVGVFQLVRSFYPAARDIRYTPEMKTAMVLKAKDVIRRGCLEYDVSATDITSSFMAIRKTMTSSGRSATYEASRSEEASHADLAWATMHALLNEPLTAGISTPLTSTILEFY